MQNNYLLIKNFLDIFCAIVFFILLLPFFIILGLIIYFVDGNPIIYQQDRPGLNGKPYKIYKFKTMRNSKDKKGKLLSDEKRLTKLGIFLRSYSLDEIPELINIIKGDMSFIGRDHC